MTDDSNFRAVSRLFCSLYCSDGAFIIDPDDKHFLFRSGLESAGRSRLGRRFVTAAIEVKNTFLRQWPEPFLDSLQSADQPALDRSAGTG
jgi:hypothetical protein